MNAQELFHEDGKPAGGWHCGKCHHVKRDEAEANRCCGPTTCDCGAEALMGWTICAGCQVARRFDRAEKRSIDEYDGDMVFVDGWDEYLSLEELDDRLACELAYFVERGGKPWDWDPPRVYATTDSTPSFNAGRMLDRALEGAYEDARDEVSAEAEAALDEFLSNWCAEHMPTSYSQNTNVALVPWPP